MAIGFPPLIPLYRVVPDPNARFERFGENNVELFGKPLDTAVANYLPSQAPWAPAIPAAAETQPQAALAPNYSLLGVGNLAGTGAATPGSLVNLTA